MIDTHCHLNHPDFTDDIELVMKIISDSGVESLICAGYDLPTSEEAVVLARRFGRIKASVGIHPHDADAFTLEAEARIRELSTDMEHVAAIGEAGLDYYRCLTPHNIQQDVFRRHIRMAHELNLPLIIHSRNAQDDVLKILADEGVPPGGAVMHCLPDDMDFAEKAVQLGCYVGLAGNLTFKNAQGIRDIAAILPINRILIETDSPYLAPHPFRGKRNDPSYLSLILEKLAELRGMTLEEAESATSANARNLFSI
ncbi:MAG: TatD family hydrolase [Armatimonadota bacterium]